MLPAPTADEVRGAFNEGAVVRFGLPTFVRTRRGSASLNLVAAMRKDPDPWYSRYSVSESGIDIVFLSSCTDFALSVDGRYAIRQPDVELIPAAIRAAERIDRHGADANEQRLAAGRIALQIVDAHVRAAILTVVDGWAAVRDLGVIEETAEGVLCKAPPETNALILIVTCPSTGRVYAHLVPAEHKTVREARRWMMGLPEGCPDPDVET